MMKVVTDESSFWFAVLRMGHPFLKRTEPVRIKTQVAEWGTGDGRGLIRAEDASIWPSQVGARIAHMF